MIDAKAVITQVQTRRSAPQWRVYSGGSKSGYWLAAGMIALLGVGCLVVGSIVPRDKGGSLFRLWDRCYSC